MTASWQSLVCLATLAASRGATYRELFGETSDEDLRVVAASDDLGWGFAARVELRRRLRGR